jgi:hypothetical protein
LREGLEGSYQFCGTAIRTGDVVPHIGARPLARSSVTERCSPLNKLSLPSDAVAGEGLDHAVVVCPSFPNLGRNDVVGADPREVRAGRSVAISLKNLGHARLSS